MTGLLLMADSGKAFHLPLHRSGPLAGDKGSEEEEERSRPLFRLGGWCPPPGDTQEPLTSTFTKVIKPASAYTCLPSQEEPGPAAQQSCSGGGGTLGEFG
ncbi:unnamed protein product [Pleuronectes platessa]|uniref:Uncharacterized protein n=1 Tax=Pleuronectes platessa TaxID=8262 RepID=A0A9N7YWQ1_PLEPL|nr:unnamed protein product [Pleuronectes platessa]